MSNTLRNGAKIWHHYICHILKLFFLVFPIGQNVKVLVIQIQRIMTISKILAGEPIKFHKISTEMGVATL